jgi:hypothetical protein
MPIDQAAILRQLDSLISEAHKFQPYIKQDSYGKHYYSNVPNSELADFLTRVVAAIERLATSGSAYVQTLRETLPKLDRIDARRIDPYVGILKALRADYDAGYLQSVTDLFTQTSSPISWRWQSIFLIKVIKTLRR